MNAISREICEICVSKNWRKSQRLKDCLERQNKSIGVCFKREFCYVKKKHVKMSYRMCTFINSKSCLEVNVIDGRNIWGYYGCDYDDSCLLGREDVQNYTTLHSSRQKSQIYGYVKKPQISTCVIVWNFMGKTTEEQILSSWLKYG
jgi:hypothetical protein